MELHNSASTNLSLKLFSSANNENATPNGSKRLTVTDGDGAINAGVYRPLF
jgi:hypothetical protein